ncbi:hypothetical protein HPB47_021595, partial [Ixodes persulcatus]
MKTSTSDSSEGATSTYELNEDMIEDDDTGFIQDCNYRSEPNCANCGCSHAATYAGCSSKKAATALRKQEILNGRAPNRRSPPSNPET